MKQVITFSILFCLVFLNVPRSFVHDCEHDKVEHSNHDEDHSSVNQDTETCFVCEFDLGFFNLSELKIPAFAKFFNYTFNKPSFGYINPEEFFAFSHRGPPQS